MEIEKTEENTRKRNRSGDDDDTDCEGSKARRKEVMDIASSSSSVAAPADADDTKKYDVFISFRGEDTRRAFTSHLHAALLKEKKITTYIDDKLKRGDEIAPALLEAINESELSVIIFSKGYASSTWCLDELVHILECKEKHGQLVIPIFYDIPPSDVRKQLGSYEVAFDQLEQRFGNSNGKVRKWRDALTNAANISGFDSKNYGTEADLVEKVVEDIWTKLCRASSCDLKGFVGIESRIEQVESLLDINPDACITVGIWGMGGIGKTTLAEAVFRRQSSKFEASSFLKNVRENSEQASGLDNLEKTLLKEILKEEGLSIRSAYVRERLSRTKVLIVLDDVSDSMQLERLVGDPLQFGTGSRIIITTRDRGTLGQTVQEDNIYEVEVLKPDDALELFCSRAFKNNSTRRTDYKELAEKVVHYAKGVPLALAVLGSLFFNCKSKEDWDDEFNKLKEFPNVDIQKVLRISYDRLGENEKEILLDIACFYKGQPVVKVKQMLNVRGFFALSGIRILIERSLISIDSKYWKETIEMHDLQQEMARKIVQEQDIKDPSKRNRLFNDKDVYRVLRSNMETPDVEVINVYNLYDLQEQPLKRLDFKKMSNLRMLLVVGPNSQDLSASIKLPNSLRYLNWYNYPLKSLPSNFTPENLVELHMRYSNFKKPWKEEQIFVNLQVIDLERCSNLTEVPNLSRSLKIVEIKLNRCYSLVEIPSYFQHLDKLTRLDLGSCGSLKYLPKMPGNIQYLDLGSSGIIELPESVWSNENISYLNLSHCRDLKKLPSSRCKLKNLEELNLNSCSQMENFSDILESMEHFKSLCLSQTAIRELPSSIYKLKHLKCLDLCDCSRLEKLPSSSVGFLSLEELILRNSYILEIPASIKQASRLRILDLDYCKRLQSIPELPVLCNVKAHGCTSLKIVSSSRTALAQGWDKPNYCYRYFIGCPKLDNNSRSNIMDEAQIPIMRMATVAPFKYSLWRHAHNIWPQINIACPGKEIPNWFSYQNEGSSIDIELCPDWFRTGLFGFALCVVVSLVSHEWPITYPAVRANFIVKFMGESHELFSSKYIIEGDKSHDREHHVHVWNEAFRSEEVGKNCSPDDYKLAKEASVVFYPVDDDQPASASAMKVESCGICPLYAEDAEKFKFGHVFMSRAPIVEEETRQDDDSKGGGSGDEPQVSGSSDESEANESE